MNTETWTRYYDASGDEPRPTLRRALALADGPGVAVDLGCGAGRDTLALLAAGWTVHAVDAEPAGIERLLAAAELELVALSHKLPPAPRREPDGPLGPGDRLHVQVARFEDARWPACDLVTSSFALPFCPPGAFPAVWERIVASLRPGGRFAGQLFGDRDGWAPAADMTFQTRAGVERLLEPFEVELLDELEEDGRTAVGEPKRWHLFHVVARKRP